MVSRRQVKRDIADLRDVGFLIENEDCDGDLSGHPVRGYQLVVPAEARLILRSLQHGAHAP